MEAKMNLSTISDFKKVFEMIIDSWTFPENTEDVKKNSPEANVLSMFYVHVTNSIRGRGMTPETVTEVFKQINLQNEEICTNKGLKWKPFMTYNAFNEMLGIGPGSQFFLCPLGGD